MQVGPYEVVSELGRGGMGVVLRARAPDGRDVAVKLLLNPKARGALPRFDRERRLLETLGSDVGFVPLLDAGEAANGPFLVMPYLAGGTLRDRLRRGPLAVDDALALGKSLARALGRAHANGIVHRDLKPENILYGQDGRPLVADLGLAKHFDRTTDQGAHSVSISREHGARGTFGYMPAEQVNDAKSVGPPADVFAIGAILYEALTGTCPFTADNLHGLMARLASGDFVAPRKLRPEIPRWLARLVERCLSKPASARPPNGDALLAELEAGAGRGGRAPLAAALGVAGVVVGAIALGARPGAGNSGGGRPEAPPPAPSPPPPPARTLEPLPAAASFPAWTKPLHVSRDGSLALAVVLGRHEWRASRAIEHLALLGQGKRCLVAGQDGLLALYDLATGRDVTVCRGHQGTVRRVAVLKGDRRAVSAGDDGTLRLFDLESGAELRRFEGHEGAVRAVAATPDGLHVISASADHKVRLFEVETGRLEAAVPDHNSGVASLAVAPDGRSVAQGGMKGQIRVSGVDNLVEFMSHDGQTGAQNDIAFLTGNRLASTAQGDRTLRVLVRSTVEEVCRIKLQLPPLTFACAADGHIAITGHQDGQGHLWNLNEQKAAGGLLVFHGQGLRAAAFTEDGRRLVTGDGDGELRVFEGPRLADVRPKLPGHPSPVPAAFPSADGKTLLTAGGDGNLLGWDLATGKASVKAMSHGDGALVAALPLGKKTRVVMLSANGAVTIVEAGGFFRWTAGARDAVAIAAAPDGERVFVGAPHAGGGAELRAFDAAGKFAWQQVNTEAAPIVALAASPDGRGVAVAAKDGVVTIRDPASGLVTRTFAHDSAVSVLAFSPDGALLFTGEGRQGRVHDVATSRPVAALGEQPLPFTAACFLDAKRVAAASKDGVIRVVDARSGAEVDRVSLGPCEDVPLGLSLAADGKTLWVSTARGAALGFQVR